MNRCIHTDSIRLWSGILGVFFMIAGLWVQSADARVKPGPEISLMVDGIGIGTDVQPLQKNGRMLVPVRAIAEKTGAKVSYDAQKRQVVIGHEHKKIVIPIDRSFAYVNGKQVWLDVPATIVNRRTLIPVRFVSEALGYHVKWDANARIAVIWSTKDKAARADRDQHSANPYVVQEGDSLYQIAKRYQVSMETVKKNNHLYSDELLAGEILYLTDQAKKPAFQPTAFSGDQKLLQEHFVFPFAAQSTYSPFVRSFGFDREWTESGNGNVRSHEGIDIMAPSGTPVYAVSSGTINRIGWNTYGGWRINITDAGGAYKMYYAHLLAFAPGLKVGSHVKAGQLIGFVGATGYGKPGTTGLFSPHLHFGLYLAQNNKAIDPYPYLRFWERHKVTALS